MNELDELRGCGRMTWLEAEDGQSLRGDVANSESDSRRENGGEA